MPTLAKGDVAIPDSEGGKANNPVIICPPNAVHKSAKAAEGLRQWGALFV